jgi:LuxR family maltose regulon positive regulatory protein
VLAALRNAAPGMLECAQGALESHPDTDMATVVTGLVNDLAALGQPLVLVLDDYHVIQTRSVHLSLGLLLDYLPANAHLILSTRADPPLALARHRARGDLSEVRAEDLRFTLQETDDFLRGVRQLDLRPEAVAALERRTQGWIVALEMAAVSLRGADDKNAAVDHLTRHDHWVADFYLEEVLQRQPEDILDLMLRLSILERLTGAACDALTGRTDGEAALEKLWRTGLPIEPLDGATPSYRYHPLFADLLRRRLQQRVGDVGVAELHRRASAWYLENGLPEEAIAHALTANDWSRAAELIEEHGVPLLFRREATVVARWLSALPADLVRLRPNLSAIHAWTLLRMQPDLPEQVEAKLHDAERALAERDRPQDQDNLAVGRIATIRALVAGIDSASAADAAAMSVAARDKVPEGHLRMRAVLAANLGLAYLRLGKVGAADHAYHEARHYAQASHEVYYALSANYAQARIAKHRGRLHRAALICHKTLEWLRRETDGNHCIPAAGMIHVLLGTILLEWNDLEAAAQSLATGTELLLLTTERYVHVEACAALARLSAARDDLDTASRSLEDAKLLTSGSTAYARALQVRLQLRRADRDPEMLAAAERWADAHPPPPGWESESPPTSHEGDWQHAYRLTWVRVLCARQRLRGGVQLEPVIRSLEQQAGLAQDMGLAEREAELYMLEALGYRSLSQTDNALTLLQKALGLLENEGYARLFADEGTPMAELLSEAQRQGMMPAYTSKLLRAVTPAPQQSSMGGAAPVKVSGEPLTEREMQVLRLIEEGLSNAEIAQRLFVAPSTVKVHTHHIYSKLGVTSRTQAAAKARVLGYLSG